jgi:hypothetical protein
MSVETLRPTADPDQEPNQDNIDDLEAMLNAPSSVETHNTTHPSSTGRALERAATFLQDRADKSRQRIVGTAHEKALNEYSATDRAGYDTHMSHLEIAEDEDGNPMEAQQEYAANRRENDRNAAHSEALKEYRGRDRGEYVDHLTQLAGEAQPSDAVQEFVQPELDRENRREARQEAKDKAKSFLRRVGRRSLRTLVNGGFIGLGLGVMGAEAAARGARKAKTSVKEAYNNERGRLAENAQMRKEDAQARKDERISARAERKEAKQTERERLEEAARREAIMRARAAQRRKNERRQRWAARRESVVNAFNTAKNFTGRQKRRIGKVASRAHASGQAAIEAWKKFEK